VLAVVKHHTNDEKQFEPFMLQFCQNIKVFTVDNLQTDIILKTKQQNQTIGGQRLTTIYKEMETPLTFMSI